MAKRMAIVAVLAGIGALAGGCDGGGLEEDGTDTGTPTDLVASVLPEPAVDIPCEPAEGWRSAVSALELSLEGDWGASPEVRIAGHDGVVRIAGRPAPGLTAPLPESGTASLTLEADLGPAITLPASIDLQFLDSKGVGQKTVTIALRLGGTCTTCSFLGTASPLMFEWQLTSGSPERDIGLSDGTTIAWTILDAWLASSGNGQVESPTVSPDGRYLAFVAHPAGSVSANSVYLLDLQGTDDPKRLTPATGHDWSDLEWSNAPAQLPGMTAPAYVLACARLDLPNLSRKQIVVLPAPADPAALATFPESTGTVLSGGPQDRVHPTWSPDDGRIAYLDLDDNSLYSIASDGSDTPVQELDAADLGGVFPQVSNPRWHPTDTDRIAFNSTGSIRVLHRSTGVSEQYAVGSIADPRYHPAWTREGNGIVYVRGVTTPTLTLRCDGQTEEPLFSLPGAEVRKIRIPRTPEAIAALEAALAP